MKKIIAIFLMMFMILGLCACGNDTSDVSDGTEADTTKTEATEALETTNSESEGTEYVITIADTENNPISGAIVQMCKLGDDGSCTPGNPSDSNGKVFFSLPEDDYKVSFIVMPAGYTYGGEEEEFYFEEGSTEITIALKRAD